MATGKQVIANASKDRIAALDGIRGFAMFAVYLVHSYRGRFPGGIIGVDIFFVLSGFVITRSLRNGSIDFRRFYFHRSLRIVPPMIPVIVFMMAVGALGVKAPLAIDVVAAIASFMNWLRAFGISDGRALGHFWSLSVEEQFYLVWPVALVLLGKVRRAAIPILIAALAAAIGWQIYLFTAGAAVERVYNGLDTRGSQLLMGCLLAMMQPVDLGKFWLLPVLGYFAAFPLLSESSAFYLTFGIPLVGIVAMLAVSIAAWSRTPLHTVLECRPVQWLGSRSYAFYLWHYPIVRLAKTGADKLGIPHLPLLLAGFVASCIAAEISFCVIERPARRIREAIDARRANKADMTAATILPE